MADRSRSTSFQSVSGNAGPQMGATQATAHGPAPWPSQPSSISALRRTASPVNRRIGRSPGAVRHGSGAVGSATTGDAQPEQTRERSRDRVRSASRASGARSASTRAVDAEQLPRSMHNAIDRLEVAVAALDLASRNQAQFMARTDEKIGELQNRVNAQANVVNTIDARSKQTETHLAQACANIIDRYKLKTECDDVIRIIDAKVDTIVSEMQRLGIAVAQACAVEESRPRQGVVPPVQTFTMSTPTANPQNASASDDPWGLSDPWNGGAPTQPAAQASAQAAPATASFGPNSDDQARMNANGQDRPGIPPTWGGSGMFSQSTQPRQHEPMPQPRASAPTIFNTHSAISHGSHKVQYMGDQDAMARKSESVRRFSGQSVDFVNWSKRMVDHMAKVHPHWRHVLEWLAVTKQEMNLSRLSTETLGPFDENARELAVKFEQVLVDWLPEYMYANRVQLCGGRDEANNGFRMWMQLHLEHVGDSELIEYAGTECLRTYGKCSKKSEMSRHIDGWISLYDRYGQELSGAHRMLRNMFLNILPSEVKS